MSVLCYFSGQLQILNMKYFKRFSIHFVLFGLLITVPFGCKEKASGATKFEFSNDLGLETSPYLLQHANNPVNWKAWNINLFDEAEKQDKLVLISIGYSSCHWCHVMERETFEDEEVAQLMNENFISIKVDREERPDVDEVYQRAIQLVNQSGGWPLNVIALPNGKPLYLGTYLPKKQWNQVLSKVNKMYTEDPVKANEYADYLSQGIQELSLFEPSTAYEQLTQEVLQGGVASWKESWDRQRGGNQGREKFMIPNALGFLLDYAVLNNDDDTLRHVKNTLDQMANGGLFDQLGGGFYRYSTDANWKIPHFEKMLYDNAQAISLYAKAYKVFKDPLYKDVVYESVTFLEREMKNEEGAYFATLNAESDGVEGKYYLWTAAELKSELSDDFELFSAYYNINESSVWENESYVLHKAENDASFIATNGLTLEMLKEQKREWKDNLMKVRATRVRPSIDDKILTSWNAMLIRAYADAYATFGDLKFLKNATTIYKFIRKYSYSDQQLLHSYKPGSKDSNGFLEDYAFMIDGSLALFELTQEMEYLNFAKELTEVVIQEYSDESSGMFTFSKDQQLISKIVKTNDGDIPSPNSVMAHNLLRLGHIDYNLDFLNKSKTMLTTLLPMVTEYTDGYANWGSLMLHVTHPYFEIVVVGENANELVLQLQKENLSNAIIIGSTKESDVSLFEDRFVAGETFIYVCQNSTCKLPVKTVAEALKQIELF